MFQLSFVPCSSSNGSTISIPTVTVSSQASTETLTGIMKRPSSRITRGFTCSIVPVLVRVLGFRVVFRFGFRRFALR